CLLLPLSAYAAKINVIAAENFYGDIAQQIGGHTVQVTSVLSNPDQDPHLFETDPSTAIALNHAQVVIFNGINYDPWIQRILSVTDNPYRVTIQVSQLLHKKNNANPHIWYNPATMSLLAMKLDKVFSNIAPDNKQLYQKNLSKFINSMASLNKTIVQIRNQYQNTPVSATEPVANDLCQLIGFKIHDLDFQLAIMNNTEPSFSAVAQFHENLQKHRVKILLYNKQASSPIAQEMMHTAKKYGIPVIGITETEPAGETYQNWMLTQINMIKKALHN
ncbi:MAG: zinc ABC transporter substrate-binding protein, partial [Pseudomonadota bacterium]|nr:zinc ABC transporter substrate-binding protein [Pseudomonadota bacterium]